MVEQAERSWAAIICLMKAFDACDEATLSGG